MNRNTEQHFAELPSVNIGRSKFDRSFTHKTTFNTGELVPVYVDMDIVPGDTVSMKQSELIRMTTPIVPVMDNCYMDMYWFFVPDRLVMNDFKKMMGENDTAPWTQTVEVNIPQAQCDSSGLTHKVEKGSVLNHMGIPIQNWTSASSGSADYKEIRFSMLPPRAYCLIWNEFFRDENLQNPVNIPKGNTTEVIINTKVPAYLTDPDAAQVTYAYRGGMPCLKVCKTHDYFTSALPGAQKGPAVTVPLWDDKIPITLGQTYDTTYNEWKDVEVTNAGSTLNITGNQVGTTNAYMSAMISDDVTDGYIALPTNERAQLIADLSVATGATITQLRQAFAIQKFYERDARGGTRYIESVKAHFGVTNPDFRLQRPEYLGGFRQNINMNQVVQTTPLIDAQSTPLGTTGAYSVTSHQNPDVFTHSFTEHGILMGLICVRTDHSYAQGINRAWFKKSRLDFYSPEFANLSEQAILNREIYAQGIAEDNEAFGYQEAWAEMRYMPDLVTGEFSPNYTTSLKYWTYVDEYSQLPSLGNKWIQEPKENLARTLAIQNQDQFIADFYFGAIYTRPMPLYSIPGLIDHH